MCCYKTVIVKQNYLAPNDSTTAMSVLDQSAESAVGRANSPHDSHVCDVTTNKMPPSSDGFLVFFCYKEFLTERSCITNTTAIDSTNFIKTNTR